MSGLFTSGIQLLDIIYYFDTTITYNICAVLCLVAQSYQTLCNPVDCSPPGSSVMGILQARILEWVTMPSSRGCSQPVIKPRFSVLQADSLPSEPPGGIYITQLYITSSYGYIQHIYVYV